MNTKKDEPEKVSTCFEGWPGAEMIQKTQAEEGIGSLSEKMMRSLIGKNEARGGTGQGPENSPVENHDQNKGDKK